MQRKNQTYVIAVDLGGTNLRVGLLGPQYKIIRREVLKTKVFIKKENLIFAVIESVAGLIRHSNLKKRDIAGVGLGLPGPVDNKRGIVHFFPNIPGWKE
ncbi:MAG: ROK family protein, partial [Candidatus Omnitrophica bacterium]|nr:ROK family protein [Candidatus Omnitrophota bacterium]